MEKMKITNNISEYISCYELCAFLEHKAKVIGLNLKEIDFYNQTYEMLRKIDGIIFDTLIWLSDFYGNETDIISFEDWNNILRGNKL